MTSRVITIGKCSEHGSLAATPITSNNSPATSSTFSFCFFSSSSSSLPLPSLFLLFLSVFARPLRGRALRGFPEEFSENLIRPYVPEIERTRERERGDTDAKKGDDDEGMGEAGQGKAEIEIRFSVDRYNPAPVPASQTVQSGLLDPNIPVETSDITASSDGTRAATAGQRREEGLKRASE